MNSRKIDQMIAAGVLEPVGQGTAKRLTVYRDTTKGVYRIGDRRGLWLEQFRDEPSARAHVDLRAAIDEAQEHLNLVGSNAYEKPIAFLVAAAQGVARAAAILYQTADAAGDEDKLSDDDDYGVVTNDDGTVALDWGDGDEPPRREKPTVAELEARVEADIKAYQRADAENSWRFWDQRNEAEREQYRMAEREASDELHASLVSLSMAKYGMISDRPSACLGGTIYLASPADDDGYAGVMSIQLEHVAVLDREDGE
jgi:hypothetical protein